MGIGHGNGNLVLLVVCVGVVCDGYGRVDGWVLAGVCGGRTGGCVAMGGWRMHVAVCPAGGDEAVLSGAFASRLCWD